MLTELPQKPISPTSRGECPGNDNHFQWWSQANIMLSYLTQMNETRGVLIKEKVSEDYVNYTLQALQDSMRKVSVNSKSDEHQSLGLRSSWRGLRYILDTNEKRLSGIKMVIAYCLNTKLKHANLFCKYFYLFGHTFYANISWPNLSLVFNCENYPILHWKWRYMCVYPSPLCTKCSRDAKILPWVLLIDRTYTFSSLFR